MIRTISVGATFPKESAIRQANCASVEVTTTSSSCVLETTEDLDHPAELFSRQPSGCIQILQNRVEDGIALQDFGIGRRKAFRSLKVTVVDGSRLRVLFALLYT